MINRFLLAKNWQIFLITVGVPIIFQLIFMGATFSDATHLTHSEFSTVMILFLVISMIPMAILFGWFWAVATGLQTVIPVADRMNVKRFKVTFFIPFIYIFLFMGFFYISTQYGVPDPKAFAIILPLHFISMFCIFYNMYFMAKTIKTAELQREASFSDFVGEFFLIWFYPIGIWFIQPKVNQLVNF
jgi:hypothetical protein